MVHYIPGGTRATLPPDTGLGQIALTVADLNRSVAFYREVLGFAICERSDDAAVLGAGATPLVALVELPGARPKPAGATGLFHFALLLPSRRDLGRILSHLLSIDYPLDGAADHLVSEAIYLADPDGNGIELYRDRPATTWRRDNGAVRMASEPLDIRGILAEAQSEAVWDGIPTMTRMGHVHLQVGDVERARAFYVDVLGFELMARMPGAVFVAAGGYHHHVGLNNWRSRNGPPPPPGSAGLRWFTVQVPSAEAREAVAARLVAAGATVDRHDCAIQTADPWGHGIVIRS